MEPERIVLEPSLADTGLETPGQPRLFCREMQRTTVGGYTHAGGSLEHREVSPFQSFLG